MNTSASTSPVPVPVPRRHRPGSRPYRRAIGKQAEPALPIPKAPPTQKVPVRSQNASKKGVLETPPSEALPRDTFTQDSQPHPTYSDQEESLLNDETSQQQQVKAESARTRARTKTIDKSVTFAQNVPSMEIETLLTQTQKDVERIKYFDLNDYQNLLSFTTNDNDFSSEEEEAAFGKVPYLKSLREDIYLLKVKNCLAFKSLDAPGNVAQCGQYKATIVIKNVSGYNATYMVQSSSNEKFRMNEQIGIIGPRATKHVVVTTNPEYKLKFQDLLADKFVVHGYPVLLRRQLEKPSIEALWNAFDCGLLPLSNLESHSIVDIQPAWDTMTTIPMLEVVSGMLGVSKCRAVSPDFLKEIGSIEFYEIWSNYTDEEKILVSRFNTREILRIHFRSKFQMEDKLLTTEKIASCGGLFLIAYLFMAYIYLLPFLQKQDIPDPTWYEKVYQWFAGLFV